MMALVSLEEAKEYLRVDSADEDALTGVLLSSAEKLCVDVARLSQEQWEAVDNDETDTDLYTEEELEQLRAIMKVSILYALGYLYENREEADHHALVMTLRNLLFSTREGVF